MPAETHRLGATAGAADILTLLCSLLGDGDADGSSTLAEVGVEQAAMGDLWDSVCEELAERSLGPDLDLDVLDPRMTLQAAAEVMATLLGRGAAGEV